MKAARFMVNAFGENTYIIWDDASREAAWTNTSPTTIAS